MVAALREENARSILQQERFTVQKLKVPAIDALLKWYNGGKKIKDNKAKKLSLLLEIMNDSNVFQPPYEPWTEYEEAELQKLNETEIQIQDTELGRTKYK